MSGAKQREATQTQEDDEDFLRQQRLQLENLGFCFVFCFKYGGEAVTRLVWRKKKLPTSPSETVVITFAFVCLLNKVTQSVQW